MLASHACLRDDFEVSTPELDPGRPPDGAHRACSAPGSLAPASAAASSPSPDRGALDEGWTVRPVAGAGCWTPADVAARGDGPSGSRPSGRRRNDARRSDGGSNRLGGRGCVPGGTSSSMRSSTSGVEADARRRRAPLSSWSIVRGPMIADVTAGCSSVQARARWASVMPALLGQRHQLVDEVELARLAGCVGSKRAGMRRARPVDMSRPDVLAGTCRSASRR